MMVSLNRGPAAAVPLVCVCGVELYAELARALSPDRRVLGAYLDMDLEVPIEEAGVALDVPALAARYIELLRAHEGHDGETPGAPRRYALGGYSFGGLIAYEMAQQLQAGGDEVALVALFDSILPRGRPRPTIRERVSGHLGRLRRSPGRFVSHLVGHARDRMGFASHAPTVADDHRYAVVQRATAEYEAIARPYEGPVAIWRALGGDGTSDRIASELGWSGLVPADTTVHSVDAEHVAVLRAPHAERIARDISTHIARFDAPATMAS